MSNKKVNKKEIIFIIIILIVQTVLYIYVGTQKSYLHIDEIYSYGLTHYKSIEITDNLDFFNNWHTKKYYEKYLTLQDDDITNFDPVYENQKNDVHPPLYYLLLRVFMTFAGNNFSKWTGIILNIIIYMFITIFMYLILKKLFENDKYSAEKSAILAFVSSVILASLSNVIYIRMYALSTLNILITIYLHVKLLENDETNFKLLIFIGISVLAGILTHYYYLLYLVPLYIIFFVKYIKKNQFTKLFRYTFAIIFAGILSLIIFPYSIKHIFFGYRGQGVISNLESLGTILKNIKEQLCILNYYGFNNTLPLILIIIVILNILKKRKIEIEQNKKEILKIISVPSIIFFVIASAGSPWNVLRYIVPVCDLIFIMIIYYLYKLLQTIFNEKKDKYNNDNCVFDNTNRTNYFRYGTRASLHGKKGYSSRIRKRT